MVEPGKETSEFKVLQYFYVFGAFCEALSAFAQQFPGSQVAASALQIVTPILVAMKSFGYMQQRTSLKRTALRMNAYVDTKKAELQNPLEPAPGA